MESTTTTPETTISELEAAEKAWKDGYEWVDELGFLDSTTEMSREKAEHYEALAKADDRPLAKAHYQGRAEAYRQQLQVSDYDRGLRTAEKEFANDTDLAFMNRSLTEARREAAELRCEASRMRGYIHKLEAMLR